MVAVTSALDEHSFPGTKAQISFTARWFSRLDFLSVIPFFNFVYMCRTVVALNVTGRFDSLLAIVHEYWYTMSRSTVSLTSVSQFARSISVIP